ncbi:MAG: PIN domain-containing protein, partial [Firmicutes bacterium]|nr:PIN domain-containing protein [Bacillota bacterium]
MKKRIDANVILRYLLFDNEDMAEKAEEIIHSGVFVSFEVMAEVIYVLKGVYKLERDEISNVLRKFTDLIETDDNEVMKSALEIYEKKKLDFVDCLLIAY